MSWLLDVSGLLSHFSLILCFSHLAENASEAPQESFNEKRKINLIKFISLFLLDVQIWIWYQWNHGETYCLSMLWKAVTKSKCQFDLPSFWRTHWFIRSGDTGFTLSHCACDPYVGLFQVMYHYKEHEYSYNCVLQRSDILKNVTRAAVFFEGYVFIPHFKYVNAWISKRC